MAEAFIVVDSALESTVRQRFTVNRVTEWDDSGLVLMAIQHECGGVYDLVVDEEGVRLKRDADV